METNRGSKTALGTAFMRAYHAAHDHPKIFDDFLDKTFSKEKKTGLYIIDEISRVEAASRKFSKLILELLGSDKPVITAISDKGTGLINDIRKREDVSLFEITEQNRELRIKELTMLIRDLLLD